VKISGHKNVEVWMEAKYRQPFPVVDSEILVDGRKADFVISTGETHSVKEFVQLAFHYAGIENWEDYIEYDPKFMRPAEVDLLLGDSSKSQRVLGFEPKVKFNELVKIMVEAEIEKLCT